MKKEVLTQSIDDVIKIEENIGVQGRFKIEAIRPDGTVRELAPWQDNLITDIGLNTMGGWQYRDMPADPGSNYVSDDATRYCWVGSGSTPPQFTDTAPAQFVRATSNVISTAVSRSQPTDTVHYTGGKRVFQFNVGEATGNLTEVGLSNGRHTNITGTYKLYMFSRALIKNANGDPITVTVLADEILQITYEHRIYLASNDPVIVNLVDGANTHELKMYPFGFGRSNTYRWLTGGYIGYETCWSTNSYGMGVMLQKNDATPLSQRVPGVTEEVSTMYIFMNGDQLSSAGISYNNPTAVWGERTRKYLCTLGVNTSPQNVRNIGGFFNNGNEIGHQWLGYINPVIHKAFDETLRFEFTTTWGRYTP